MGEVGDAGAMRAELDRLRAELEAQQGALRASEELLRSVMASTPNLIATTDAVGNLLFVNNAPPYDGLLGAPAWAHLIEADRDHARTMFETMMHTGQQQRLEVTGESGTRWRVQLGPRFESGRIIGATYVAWDVTEQRHLETRLAIADRMAALGTLAAGVAHEINNPLTYVLANLEWASRSIAEGADREMHERIAAALEGAARIRDVVADLRSFSHVESERTQLLDVHALLDTALRMAQTETRCRAHVITCYEETPPVLGSEARLGQVFLNLIVNAAQSLIEGEASRHEIVITASTGTDGCAVVEVRDTGSGIAPELLERIFDPFVTTKPRDVGTGLGLYICRNVIGAAGGALSVRSTLGVGTTFRVTLPAAQAVLSSRPPASGATSCSPAARKLRLLVADDERGVAEVVRGYLADHDVDVVHSGRDAIERLGHLDYDLAFCDLIMPDLTGMDVFEYLRAQDPHRAERVVFMTGNAFTPRAQSFLESVRNPVLHKPFSRRDIHGALARMPERPSP